MFCLGRRRALLFFMYCLPISVKQLVDPDSTRTHNHLTVLCLGLPVWASTRSNIHPLTPILIIRHLLSTSSIYYDPQHPPCSIYVHDSPFPQCLQVLLVFILVWDPVLYTPYISSLSHHLFATHVHTMAACFAVVPVSSIPNLSQLLTQKSVFYLNAKHPYDHSPDSNRKQ